jgi:hypothetical protein
MSVACAVPPALASRLRMQQNNAPERSASARVQVDGGAVVMVKGELVFDGVAISDTNATVRRPRPRAPVGPSAVCRGGPAPDRRRVQGYGGAVYIQDGAVTFRGSSTIARTRAVRLALTPGLQIKGTPERSASARVQATGGAVAMFKGALVFDGVAISDTSAAVRRPPAARAGRPLRLRACGGPAPDRRRVQDAGGAVYMGGGAVTFRGSSTITRTQAVRPALPRAHALARTWSTSVRCWHWHWHEFLI